jgi:hypothetical protein
MKWRLGATETAERATETAEQKIAQEFRLSILVFQEGN